MKHKGLMVRVIMLFAFLLVTSISFAQITTEVDMAKAVLETIKNSDLETFSSYLPTDEILINMLEGMEESTPKEKAIKQELKGEDAASMRDECINAYNAFIKDLKTNKIAMDKGVFKEVLSNETRFEVTNCKAISLKFVISFNDVIYNAEIDVFKTKAGIFIYNCYFQKLTEQD